VFLYGTAAADAVNAALALGFVVGFFARRRWHTWLGTLTLTMSVYGAGVFTYGTVAIGAWVDHLAAYLARYAPFLPVIALCGLWCVRRARELCEVPQIAWRPDLKG
jgi:hypothetical protein